MPSRKAYHHGDLRRALLEASIALIEEHGVEALSLREAARRAGVSPAAPYHHFGSKAGLLGAIAGNGFTGLTAAMQAVLATLADSDARDDPFARLAALGRAYVAFARERPTEYGLMFRPRMVSAADLPADCRPEASFELLLAAVDAVVPRLPPGLLSREVLTVIAWSITHGASDLVLDGPLGQKGPRLPVDPDQVGPLAVDGFAALLRRLAQPETDADSPRPARSSRPSRSPRRGG